MQGTRTVRSRKICFHFSVATIAILACVGPALSCQVPVFRFALERWSSDQYEVSISSATSTSVGDLFTTYEKGRTANLTLTTSNESNEIRVFRPRHPNKPVWKGPFNHENAAAVIDSPKRQKLVEKILSGDSVVWIFLPGKDSQVNQTARETLQSTMAIARKDIQIPEGVVTSDEVTADNFSGDPEDIVDGDIPLKIDFSMLEVSREDPAEAVFIAMLLSVEDDLHDFSDSPMLFPAFGRGRVLEPLIGKGITPDNLLTYCVYLCGACSCEVKDQNPGMDLLLATNWDAADAATVTTATKAAEPKPETVHFNGEKSIPVAAAKSQLPRLPLIGLAMVLLLFGGLLFFKRGGEKQ